MHFLFLVNDVSYFRTFLSQKKKLNFSLDFFPSRCYNHLHELNFRECKLNHSLERGVSWQRKTSIYG